MARLVPPTTFLLVAPQLVFSCMVNTEDTGGPFMDTLIHNDWLMIPFALLVGVVLPAGLTLWWRYKNDPYVKQQARRKKYKRKRRHLKAS